ncbi:MAG: hypothetical protein ABIN58_13200 [candidate division WOR-3 bacterium]
MNEQGKTTVYYRLERVISLAPYENVKIEASMGLSLKEGEDEDLALKKCVEKVEKLIAEQERKWLSARRGDKNKAGQESTIQSEGDSANEAFSW